LPSSLHQRVEVAERYADGAATHHDLQAAFPVSQHWVEKAALPSVPGGTQAAHAVGQFRFWPQSSAAVPVWGNISLPETVSRFAAEALAKSMPWQMARQLECQLLRDIFGPPTFRLVVTDPGWVAWNGSTIPALAQAIYDDHAFGHLPILADALEEAGCA